MLKRKKETFFSFFFLGVYVDVIANEKKNGRGYLRNTIKKYREKEENGGGKRDTSGKKGRGQKNFDQWGGRIFSPFRGAFFSHSVPFSPPCHCLVEGKRRRVRSAAGKAEDASFHAEDVRRGQKGAETSGRLTRGSRPIISARRAESGYTPFFFLRFHLLFFPQPGGRGSSCRSCVSPPPNVAHHKLLRWHTLSTSDINIHPRASLPFTLLAHPLPLKWALFYARFSKLTYCPSVLTNYEIRRFSGKPRWRDDDVYEYIRCPRLVKVLQFYGILEKAVLSIIYRLLEMDKLSIFNFKSGKCWFLSEWLLDWEKSANWMISDLKFYDKTDFRWKILPNLNVKSWITFMRM